MSFAINNTLATIDGQSQVEHIQEVSPLPAGEVRAILEHDLQLKTLGSATELTEELAVSVCRKLGIQRADLGFGTNRLAPFRLLPDAVTAVHLVTDTGTPAVTISNASVFSLDDGVMNQVEEGLREHLAAMYYSCRMGVAKPNPQIFRTAAAEHGRAVQDLVHVGPSWEYDVAPILAAGGRAVWIRHPGAAPGSDVVPAGRLLVAPDILAAARALVERWLG